MPMLVADIWKAECLPGTTPLFYAGGETGGGISDPGFNPPWLVKTLHLYSHGLLSDFSLSGGVF